jgi:hypothetical protein
LKPIHLSSCQIQLTSDEIISPTMTNNHQGSEYLVGGELGSTLISEFVRSIGKKGSIKTIGE